MRHLETPTLRVQRALKLGQFRLVKLPGKVNCGDIGTKHVVAMTMRGHLERMGVVLVGFAHDMGLKAKVWADGLGGYGELHLVSFGCLRVFVATLVEGDRREESCTSQQNAP